MTLRPQSVEVRLPGLRARILQMIHDANAGHPGGSLSVVDILAVILLCEGRFAPAEPCKDWLVLAKGHAVPALYALLVELGYFQGSELSSYRQLGSRLQGHPDRCKTPGIQVSSGHLGQGLSVGVGIAMGEMRRASGKHAWVVGGEGDLHEGQTWEALMSAAHHRVHGLTLVLDLNGMTQHGLVTQVMSIEPICAKLSAFGWIVEEVDGHDPGQLHEALSAAKAATGPVAVLAHTVKGRGVSFMEGVREWHSQGITDDELAMALAEVEG